MRSTYGNPIISLNCYLNACFVGFFVVNSRSNNPCVNGSVLMDYNYFYVCTGLNGTDNRNLNCIGNKTARTLTLYNGFNRTAAKPKLIIFTVDMLQNPAATDITTDSFKLETFTFFESRKLDSISKFLTVSFNCSLPCKTCRDERTYCTSC